ncbi:hypothetical protein N7497_011420 [Penicillium chrysogenum]|nr:hypothetical protein N7497_011420 [Penicillium chrysogenum]
MAIEQSALANLKHAGLSEITYLPGQQSYEDRVSSYWSLTAQLRPWIIVQPRTTQEVSETLKALVSTPGCKFAIRSGGHMAWAGANNIEAGVTIDLGLMTTTTYNPDTKIASLQPGGTWAQAYSELEKYGVMVAGGREGLVGIGGLLLGGGIAFHSCRYGFACDQVINYEVVLADGSIVQANKTTNSDLFSVLKGGSNNFGIVTRFDMMTFEATNIWDGDIVLPKTATGKIIEAFVDFEQKLNEAPDDHILAMWTYLPQTKDHFINMVLTNLDGVENAKSLQEFLALPGQRSMKTTTVAKKLVDFVVPSGKHPGRRSENINPGRQILYLHGLTTVTSFICKAFYGPGGNLLGIEKLQKDCVLLVAAVEVETPEISTEFAYPKLKAAIGEIELYAKSVDGDVGFLYLNYCDGSQDPFQTYGEASIREMREAMVKYDPSGVFQTRVPGGFKLSQTGVRN